MVTWIIELEHRKEGTIFLKEVTVQEDWDFLTTAKFAIDWMNNPPDWGFTGNFLKDN